MSDGDEKVPGLEKLKNDVRDGFARQAATSDPAEDATLTEQMDALRAAAKDADARGDRLSAHKLRSALTKIEHGVIELRQAREEVRLALDGAVTTIIQVQAENGST